MAIYIIDQFSLNTDLPLDIRYVPENGRFDIDISIFKYPGMQVYDSSTQSVWFCDNSLNWVGVGSDDASLGAVYAYLNDLSTNINIIDGSITNLYEITSNLDTSIGLNTELLLIHDTSIGLNTTGISTNATAITNINNYQVIQDASILANETGVSNNATSITNINNYQVIQDASILANETGVSNNETAITNINNYQVIQDASILANANAISSGDAYNVIQDASILANETGVSTNATAITNINNYQVIQDASILANETGVSNNETAITNINNYQVIQDVSITANTSDIANLESSLGLFVAKTGDTMTGALSITSGNLTVTENITAQDGTFLGDVGIRGNLTVDGSVTAIDSERLDISTNFIKLNTGLEGNPPEWLQSGIIIERGDASSYAMIFDETDRTFRIGVVWNPDASGTYADSLTAAVTTRAENMTDNGIVFWEDNPYSNGSINSNTNFTYDGSSVKLTDASLFLDAYKGATDMMLIVGTDGLVRAQITSDASIKTYIDDYNVIQDASILANETGVSNNATAITNINNYQVIQDVSITANETGISNNATAITNINNYQVIQDVSITANTTSITNINNYQVIQDVSIAANTTSIGNLDTSIDTLYGWVEDNSTAVKGAINVGDGSAQVYSGISVDGSLQFREIKGIGAAVVTENGNLIEISLDGAFSGEVNTASNIGDGDGLVVAKDGVNLPFKTISTNAPSEVIITTDNSTLYIDVSIAPDIDASLVGLSDTSINEGDLNTHSNLEFDASQGKWINTDNIWWDSSLGTTTDDLGGIAPGTDLSGLTLKEILFKLLYEYQVPTLTVGSSPVGGIYEKGISATQFSSIDINWTATNANYPLALLNEVKVVKSGTTIHTSTLGGVASDTDSYTDSAGITNWGGTTRTINYNVEVSDDQGDQSQPSIIKQSSFTFYYRQFWGVVPSNTKAADVDSAMIEGLSDSRLTGATDLAATFTNPGFGFIKYLYAYPDTVGGPDDFGTLSQIVDQNEFDLTDSFISENELVDVDGSNVRYRFYLSKNKVNTAEFGITFKF